MDTASRSALAPLLFRPVYKDYLWGGSRIAGRFGRAGAPSPCAESWEVSCHPDGMSVVEGGPFDGRSLDSLCREFGAALVGSWCENPGRFPVIVKLIDATSRLSVQVHPSEESAARFGGDPKTEAWYFIDAEPGAAVCAGLKKGVGPRVFSDAVKEKSVPSLLRTVPAEPGKAVFIPGGTVHAICEGCLVLEVQQNSNTTYRVYDWDRTGPDGRPRELHVQRALEAISWHAPELPVCTPYRLPSAVPENVRERVVRSDWFSIERWTLAKPEPFVHDGRSFKIFFALGGDLGIAWPGAEAPVRVPAGRSCLVPASSGECSVSAAAGAAAPVAALCVGL